MSGYTGAYGQDSATFPRLDMTFQPLNDDAQILLQDCGKLLRARQGYVWWSPDTETMDVADLLLDSTTDEDRAATAARIERVLLGDQRIAQATATITIDLAANELRIEVLVIPVVGVAFAFVATVSGATAEVKIERTS